MIKRNKNKKINSNENAEMVLNNNKQIKHHTDELPNAIKGKNVPAWVVAKVNRSASDLSDVTHYMDGQGDKFETGGALNNDMCIQKVVDMISRMKDVDDYYIVDRKLVIILKEELRLYDLDILNYHLSEIEGCSNVIDNEFEIGYGEEYKTLILSLKTDDFTKHKFKKGGDTSDLSDATRGAYAYVKLESGGMLSNKLKMINIEFDDQTDRRHGMYSFSFETIDNEGASVLDYSGYIIERPIEDRRDDEIEWDNNVPEDWEKAEDILINAFYNWKRNKYANGGEVSVWETIDGEIVKEISKFNGIESILLFSGHFVEVKDSKIIGSDYLKVPNYVVDKINKDLNRNIKYDEGKYSNGGGVGDEKPEHYRYLTIQKLKNGLKISLNEEGIEMVKELKEDDNKSSLDIWSYLFDDVQGNSEYIFHYDMGDSGFGMTSAEGITDGYFMSENGNQYETEYPESAEVYWFPNYEVEDSLETMIKEGNVFFSKAKSMENGGGVGEKTIYYKGMIINRLFPSGYYQFFSETKGNMRFDDLKEAKKFIDDELKSLGKKEYSKGGGVGEDKLELFYVMDNNGNVKNISKSYEKANEFLEKSLKFNGNIGYKNVPKSDWYAEKINVSNIKNYANGGGVDSEIRGGIRYVKGKDLEWSEIMSFDIADYGEEEAEKMAYKFVQQYIKYWNGELNENDFLVKKSRNGKDFKGSWVVMRQIPKYAKGGEIEINDSNSLRYFLLNHASSGMIANKIPYSDYKTIDAIRLTALQILNRDGDREYSVKSFSDLIQEALLEYEENKYEGKYAKGGGVGKEEFVKFGDLAIGNIYFQVTRPNLGIEKIEITKKENGTYTYKSDNNSDETYVTKYSGRYTDNEKLYGIFSDKDEAKQMAINLLTEQMSKYAEGGGVGKIRSDRNENNTIFSINAEFDETKNFNVQLYIKSLKIEPDKVKIIDKYGMLYINNLDALDASILAQKLENNKNFFNINIENS